MALMHIFLRTLFLIFFLFLKIGGNYFSESIYVIIIYYPDIPAAVVSNG